MISLYLNYTGNYYSGGEVESSLDFFSLGNQYGFKDPVEDSTIDRNYLMVWISDGACSGIFLLMIFFYFLRSYIAIQRSMVQIKKVSDYALEVKGIPRYGVSKQEIQDHFSQFGEVVEVYLGRRYQNILYYYTVKSQIIEELKIKENLLKFNNIDPATDKAFVKLKKKLDKFDEKIRKSRGIKNHDQLEIKKAYVVFNQKEDKIKCLKEYNKNKCCRKQKENLWFLGKIKIKVFQSVEPSDIIWENLEVGKCSRFFRFLVSIFFTVLILLLSVAMIYYVKTSQSKIPGTTTCYSTYCLKDNCTSASDKCCYAESSDKGNDQTLCYCQDLTYSDLLNKSTGTCSVYLEYLSYA